MQSFIDLLCATILQSNESWFRIGWLGSFLNDDKKEKHLERIPRKMVVLKVMSTLLIPKKVQKKRKSRWRSYWRTLRGALKTVFFLHSSDKKIIAKSAKKKKSGIRWPSMLLKENSVSKLFRRYLRQFKKPHWQPRALLF